MADVFKNKKLPKGYAFRGGNVSGSFSRKFSDATRYGTANILHDKVDVINEVLQKYANYIRTRGGLSRLQILSAAREIKSKGSLTLGEYRLLKEFLREYGRGEHKVLGILGKKKNLAKESGIEARKKEYALEEEKPEKAKISALEERRIRRVASARHLIDRISGKPRTFGLDQASLREKIKNQFREGDETAGRGAFNQISTSALRIGGVKGSALNRGIVANAKPVVSVADLNKNNPSGNTPKNFGGKRPMGF